MIGARHPARVRKEEDGDARMIEEPSADARSELRALLQAREPLYALASVTVDTSRLGLEGAIKEVARRVSRALATNPGTRIG